MTTDELEPELSAFLSEHVHTFEQLEVLLFMHRRAARYWSASEVANELALTSDLTPPILERLAERGLLKRDPARAGWYRFEPIGPSLQRQIEALVRTERDNRLLIVKAMSANALERLRSSALRTFAEAFRFRDKRGKSG